VLRGGLPQAAELLRQRAASLQEEFRKATFDQEVADVLSLRAARLTARLLEVAAETQNRMPAHLASAVNVKAVRQGGLNRRTTADRLQARVREEAGIRQALSRVQPLAALANRDLAPDYPDVGEVPIETPIVLAEIPPKVAPDTSELGAVDITITADEIAIEIRRRSAELKEAALNAAAPSMFPTSSSPFAPLPLPNMPLIDLANRLTKPQLEYLKKNPPPGLHGMALNHWPEEQFCPDLVRRHQSSVLSDHRGQCGY